MPNISQSTRNLNVPGDNPSFRIAAITTTALFEDGSRLEEEAPGRYRLQDTVPDNLPDKTIRFLSAHFSDDAGDIVTDEVTLLCILLDRVEARLQVSPAGSNQERILANIANHIQTALALLVSTEG